MSDDKNSVFKINAYTPATFPMARLAEYMSVLSALLGEQANVHFDRLESGSTGIVLKIDHEARPKVTDRLRSIQVGNAEDSLKKITVNLNNMLKKDNCDAVYLDKEQGTVIEFPGIGMVVPETYGPISQHGTVDGVLQRIGGKDDTVPVWLEERDGTAIKCSATRSLAKDLAKYLFGEEIRCTGIGEWERDESGRWVLAKDKDFVISGFEVLGTQSLIETVVELRAVEGSGWRSIDDPWGELEKIRKEGEAENGSV